MSQPIQLNIFHIFVCWSLRRGTWFKTFCCDKIIEQFISTSKVLNKIKSMDYLHILIYVDTLHLHDTVGATKWNIIHSFLRWPWARLFHFIHELAKVREIRREWICFVISLISMIILRKYGSSTFALNQKKKSRKFPELIFWSWLNFWAVKDASEPVLQCYHLQARHKQEFEHTSDP